MGPRRVGKTIMLYHMVQDLIDNGHNPKRIIFITIENPIYNNISLEELFLYAKEAAGGKQDGGWVVIFDEIQYCKDWEVHLKSLVDSFKHEKFIASGSAAAALKYASTESGAGRFTDFMLPPLTFDEYISFTGLEAMIHPIDINWEGRVAQFYTSTHLDELNKQFIDYINYGGYPEVIFSPSIRENPGRFLRQDIIDKVLLRDLPSLYGIKDTRELNSLFTTIAFNTGNEFDLEGLSKHSGVEKHKIKKYLEYLEAAFLIKIVRRVDRSGKRFKREDFFKIYLTNPSLRSALFAPLKSTDDLIGNVVETSIFAQWAHRHWFTPFYARWRRGEVDIVGLNDKSLKPKWAVEIKYTNRYYHKPGELRSLLKFCSENQLHEAVVTTIDKEATKELDGIELQFFPAAAYAYTIGRRTIKMQEGSI